MFRENNHDNFHFNKLDFYAFPQRIIIMHKQYMMDLQAETDTDTDTITFILPQSN